jgi:hypothetical protein
MEILIFALGCALPAAFVFLFSHPTRAETDDEYVDRIFTKRPHGKNRLRKRVPEYGYSKRPAKRRKRH